VFLVTSPLIVAYFLTVPELMQFLTSRLWSPCWHWPLEHTNWWSQ